MGAIPVLSVVHQRSIQQKSVQRKRFEFRTKFGPPMLSAIWQVGRPHFRSQRTAQAVATAYLYSPSVVHAVSSTQHFWNPRQLLLRVFVASTRNLLGRMVEKSSWMAFAP